MWNSNFDLNSKIQLELTVSDDALHSFWVFYNWNVANLRMKYNFFFPELKEKVKEKV